MATVRLDLAYDGTGFRGYARQEGIRTVQGELERALGTLLGTVPDTAVAGRTDAGVHARGQVVSVQLSELPDPDRMRRSLNGLLGPEVVVHRVSVESDGFHARHSALWRRYLYRLGTGHTADPLTRHWTWQVGDSLDLGAMGRVATHFEGEHDFSSLCRRQEGRSNIRNVTESNLVPGDGVVEYWVTANAFCHQMVRSLVGYLYDIGRGFSPEDGVREVIGSRDRSLVSTVAPPHGLTLWEVGYRRSGIRADSPPALS